MQASTASSRTACSHLAGPPATPTARQPWIFASCPTTLPTAPAAADTTTVSPAFGLPICVSPYQAVTPGIPRTPRYAEGGASEGSIFRTAFASATWNCCQPPIPVTRSPLRSDGSFDSTTSPTVPPIITSPTGWGGAYDR